MENKVHPEEILYRIVKRSRPDGLDGKKPTSALFKDFGGISVDRDFKRSESVITDSFKKRFNKRMKGLVKVTANTCYEAEAFVIPAPSQDNQFHAHIFDSEKMDSLGSLKALMIADMCELIYFDDDIEWIKP
ncbi:hypothetical protein [uncultured Robinsoniella sp.]|uniref:hypothetical protein n=1 Tax=uncultured Robinsoniella sp. TaxID=904190 RepID=UPI0020624692|nr:MAG TPA: hypothetical protein [Caudoviricetes sp.]